MTNKIVATKMGDRIEFEFLDDGTLKMETGKISMANHGNAEALLRKVVAEMGGGVEVVRRGLHKHSHGLVHDHEHEKV